MLFSLIPVQRQGRIAGLTARCESVIGRDAVRRYQVVKRKYVSSVTSAELFTWMLL